MTKKYEQPPRKGKARVASKAILRGIVRRWESSPVHKNKKGRKSMKSCSYES